jgi:gliding motility-associated-like protein
MRRNFTRWLCLGSALLSSSLALASTPSVQPLPTDQHPLRFVPNQRQWEKPVLFAADIPSGRLFLERGRLLVARYDARAVDELHHHPVAGQTAHIPAHAYAVSFVGANPRAAVQGEAPTGDDVNYLLGNDPSRWATHVPAYTDVRYQQLYPGTDLRFYSRGEVMEYDFELAAGADPSRIRLRYDGQQALSVVDGALHVATSVGRVTEQKPFAYQLVHGVRVPVPCHYVLGPKHTVSFGLPKGYNHALPLVIDPVLVYSSYTGSSTNTWGYTAANDTLGNLYSGSIVFSAGYPATTGAYDLSFNGGSGSSINPGSVSPTDILIVKYNPAAPNGSNSRLSATYLGGSGNDFPHSLVVDGSGNLVLLGSTSSTNFPTSTTGRFRSNAGSTDLVVTKLSPDLRSLLAGTYLGGSGVDGQLAVSATNDLYQNFGDDFRGDIITDAQGNIYLTSVTRSTNFPSTGGFQTSSRGGHEAVVSKLNTSLSTLLWSSYLGGTSDDAGYSIQLDAQGGVFVSGGTRSTNFPGTAGGLHPSYQGGAADGFVAHIAPTGSQLLQATYLGTSAYDQAYFVQLDRQGAVYVLGQTNGLYPLVGNAYRGPAGSRQFIHKLNNQLTSTVFSTVFGNGPGTVTAANPSPTNLSPTAFLVDNCGQILLSGWGASSIAGMPTTADALLRSVSNTTPGSGTSANENTFGYLYVLQLSANARRVVYGTYYGNGATHVDGGTSRFDKKGTIYQTVCVRGSNPGALQVSANAYASSYGGGGGSASFKMDVLKLDAAFVPAANGLPNVRTGCAPLTVTFTRPNPSNNGTTWNFGNGRTSTQPNNVTTTYAAPGRYLVRLTAYDSLSCQPSATDTVSINVLGLPRAAAGPDQAICAGSPATLSVAGTVSGQPASYVWSPAAGLSATTGASVVATPLVTTQYIVQATLPASGCVSRDTIVVNVTPIQTISISASQPTALPNESLTFTASSAAPLSSYRWDFGNGQTSQQASPNHAYTTPGVYTVHLVSTYGSGCTADASFTVTVATPRDFKYPNIITPNNDGLNDTFQPYVSAEPVSIQVFSRWGRKVFEQENYTDGWGNDPAIAAGIYYYRLSTASGQSWNGWLEVVK